MTNFLRLRRTPKLAVPKHETDTFFSDPDGVFKKMAPDGTVSEVGGGGGALPVQWTIGAEGQLQITLDAGAVGGLAVLAGAGASGDTVNLGNTDNDAQLRVTANGDVILRNANGSEVVLLDKNSDALLFGAGSTVMVTANGYLGIEQISTSPPDDTEMITGFCIPWFLRTAGRSILTLIGKETGGTVVTPSFRAGTLVTAQTTVPPDAMFSPGECGLWFDASDGAAKLMAKGKTADGTVVSAVVAALT